MNDNSFDKFFDEAKKSPIYWLERLNLKYQRKLVNYKKQYKKKCVITDGEEIRFKTRIKSLNECIADIKELMEKI